MIDAKLLLEEIWNRFNSFYNDARRFEPEETEMANIVLADINKIIEQQPKVDEWIPVSETLPEDETLLYWTTHEDGSIVLHGYTKRNGFIYNWEVDDLEKRKRQGQVIAWIPIFEPEPYKGE